MIGTEMQQLKIQKFLESFDQSISVFKVGKEAICISTPFLDQQGMPTRIYVTKDGRITDGGTTVNLLRALDAFDQLENWPFLLDFLSSYCITYDGSSMMLNEKEDGECYLRYTKGISRLPSFFEAKPIYSTEGRFPERVKNIVIELIEERYPKDTPEETQKWISSLIRAKPITLKNGYTIHSDLSPVKADRMMGIISHSRASPSVQRTHVQSKLLDPILWKRENQNVEIFAVLEDITSYPHDSRELLDIETTQVIETKDAHGKEELVELLVR